ncbi:hypothetical protein LA284_004385 [Vibrio vulnificus]|uniref:type VI secretion system-associated protein TagO n=1 Tax=Vibrio cholerae TaxID=666 RepID=UPI001D3FF757|nr:type VI secretion system-associated protein TagO [Vibrio cholerae]EID0063036.1 hypothetical protein [Vibrio vulnificus]EID0719225.1 hypothetical protein [Vibrio vulnificus]EID0743287.1 hypothetical protein [Vibrio vulnificus]EJL7820177.1 hypothetical protein [Vibrio vulnificus]EKF9277619.1 hypothetical protein [Vibrio cholerae]
MKKSVVALICLGIAVPVGLYGYGYKQGLNVGQSGSSTLAAGIIAISMNPLSQSGFKSGYLDGLTKKKELDEWSQEYFGPWTGWESKDKITDFPNYYLVNEGDIGPYSEKATLTLRCLNDKTEIYVNWGAYLIGNRNDQLAITHRIDSQEAVTSNWSLSTDKKAFFYTGNDIGFIKSLIGKEKLIMQFEDQSTKTVTFNLDKLDEKIQPLAMACSWKV